MARKVIYGSNVLDVEDNALTVKEIQASMAEIFPELKNAEASVEGDNITFTVKAGTKGMARKVIYGSNVLDVEDDALSVKEIQTSMAEIFPELKNAEASVSGSNITFTVKAGTKGMARKVIYGSNTLDVEDDALSVKEIQASMAEIFPELKNAEASVSGSNITFTVKAGTKGMARKVVYGSNTLDVEDDALSVKEIQASMAEIFPELKNADASVQGDNIVFTVKAGTKGARFTRISILVK